jgi:hypothetical protein
MMRLQSGKKVNGNLEAAGDQTISSTSSCCRNLEDAPHLQTYNLLASAIRNCLLGAPQYNQLTC